jgi:hypothetical protein
VFEIFFLFWTDVSEELWNDVPQNGEDLSYMFDGETTPVKACGDLAHNVNNNGGKTRLFFGIWILFTLSFEYMQVNKLNLFLFSDVKW